MPLVLSQLGSFIHFLPFEFSEPLEFDGSSPIARNEPSHESAERNIQRDGLDPFKPLPFSTYLSISASITQCWIDKLQYVVGDGTRLHSLFMFAGFPPHPPRGPCLWSHPLWDSSASGHEAFVGQEESSPVVGQDTLSCASSVGLIKAMSTW